MRVGAPGRGEAAFLAANRAICAALMASACGLVFANVVLRYGFGASLAWAEEAARYLVIWLSFLGAGLALREGAHIAVEALPDALPGGPARALRLLVVLLVGASLAAVLWLGWQYAQFAWGQRSPVMRLSAGAVYLAVPVGCALMLAHLALAARDAVLRPGGDDAKVRAAELGGAL